MKKLLTTIKVLLLFIAAIMAAQASMPVVSAQPNGGKEYFRIVVLADAHYPCKVTKFPDLSQQRQIAAAKLKTVDEINSWNDVDLVVIVGDIVASTGSVEEYAQAKEFTDRFTKPLALIAGNHEYMYDDNRNNAGKLVRGTPQMRREKLKRYQAVFGELYYSKMIGRYRLIFLSPDVTDGRHVTELSQTQLDWLKAQLTKDSGSPTLLFFHAPLRGTLLPHNDKVVKPGFGAQPIDKIQKILLDNLQIKAWISGHTHTPPTKPSFNHPVNWFAGKILNIYTTDMDRQTIWSNSLYLYKDRIVVKTFNHRTGQWLGDMERIIPSN